MAHKERLAFALLKTILERIIKEAMQGEWQNLQ